MGKIKMQQTVQFIENICSSFHIQGREGGKIKKITMRYGVDAPFWVAFLIILGLVFTLLGVFGSVNGFVLSYGLICLVTGLRMFIYSTTIKIAHREVILSLAQAKSGDELLDVGTGRGL